MQISLLTKILFNKFTACWLLAVLFICFILYQRYQISILSSNIDEYKQLVANLESQVTAKNDEIDLTNKNVSLSNSRLTQCYTQLKASMQSQKEIDAIMSETEPTEKEPSESLVEKDVINPTESKTAIAEVSYTPVTKYQMKRGMEFVNKQMKRISDEGSNN